MSPIVPATCEDVEPKLNQIWRAFRSEGITDDLAIIEHLAFLLLCRHTGIWDAISDALEPPDGFGGGVPRIIQAALERQLEWADRDLLPAMPAAGFRRSSAYYHGNHHGMARTSFAGAHYSSVVQLLHNPTYARDADGWPIPHASAHRTNDGESACAPARRSAGRSGLRQRRSLGRGG